MLFTFLRAFQASEDLKELLVSFSVLPLLLLLLYNDVPLRPA